MSEQKIFYRDDRHQARAHVQGDAYEYVAALEAIAIAAADVLKVIEIRDETQVQTAHCLALLLRRVNWMRSVQ